MLTQDVPVTVEYRASLWPMYRSVVAFWRSFPLLEAIRVSLLDNRAGDRWVALPENRIGMLQKHQNYPHDRFGKPGEQEIAGRFHTIEGSAESETKTVRTVSLGMELLHPVDVDGLAYQFTEATGPVITVEGCQGNRWDNLGERCST
jgi:hypothetical protein